MAARDKTLDERQFRTVADVSLAAVTGIDVATTGIAASKADVDTRLATIQAKINELIGLLRKPTD